MKISILIPCYNEEKSIKRCVASCLNQTRRANEIVVVNDASTDKTVKILKTFGKKIKLIHMPYKGGNKSFVQQEGLKYIKGDVFITVDADTILDKHFVERVEIAFKDRKVTAFAGYVKSLKDNWLTACRELDYVVGQNIHKLAQSYIDYIYVIPGCAGAFRTDVFKKYITFDYDTLTEDLDFTYKLHKLNKKIVYDRLAIVYTQDPSTLHSYVNQLRRWYAGGWQNLMKHKDLVFNRPQTSLELSLVYLEGLVFSFSLYLLPFININLYFSLAIVYLFTISLFAFYAILRSKRWDLLTVVPVAPIVIYIQGFIFLEQFFKEVILGKKNLVWFHPERRAIA